MAKKKKKHRRPVAPPVHSAPGAAAPSAHTPVAASPPARPAGAERPAPEAPVRRKPPKRKSSRALGKRRRRVTPWVVTIVIVAAIVAAVAGSRISANKSAGRFDSLAATAGCGKVQTISGLSRQHLDGQRIHYSTSPPAGGDHYQVPLPAGFYAHQLTTSTANPAGATSIYRAVHSLEHGAVIVWYKGLSPKAVSRLKDQYDGEAKVIVTPYSQLKDSEHVALSAWGHLDYCKQMSTKVIDAFIDRYRDAHSAPEAGLSI